VILARPGQAALFAALLALLVVFIAYPLARVLVVALSSPEGLTLGHLAAFFRRDLFVEALALPLALLLARYEFPGCGLAQTLAVLPLVVPPFVGAVAFQQVLGRSGVVARTFVRITLPLLTRGLVAGGHPEARPADDGGDPSRGRHRPARVSAENPSTGGPYGRVSSFRRFPHRRRRGRRRGRAGRRRRPVHAPGQARRALLRRES